jgi:hypothetical protein
VFFGFCTNCFIVSHVCYISAFDSEGNQAQSKQSYFPSRRALQEQAIMAQARAQYSSRLEAEAKALQDSVRNPFEHKAKLNKQQEMNFARPPVVSDPIAAQAITFYSSEPGFIRENGTFGKKNVSL